MAADEQPQRTKPHVERSIRQDAADTKHGMTLDEVAAFVQEAMRQEIPGGAVVKMTSTWKSSIKKLEIKG